MTVVPTPVAAADRIETIDVVRGFALLGILLLNILGFGLPFEAYSNPGVDGATSGVNLWVFGTVDLLFEGVLRALFSMLFGAGVVIFASGKPAGLYYRRQLLLLAFGLFDAFVLLWVGDILVTYALAGMLLYYVRDWSPKRLLVGAGVVFTYLAVVYSGAFFGLTVLGGKAAMIEAEVAAGAEITAGQQNLLDEWHDLRTSFEPTEETQAIEALSYQGSYLESVAANASGVLDFWAQALPLVMLWDALGCMLIGMALFKLGVFQGERDSAFYRKLVVYGVVIGLAINGLEVYAKIASGFALEWVASVPVPTGDIGRVALALGYLGMIVLVCQTANWVALRDRLAAVGRMALTNYLMHSLLALLVFHSIGLGLWNQLERYELYFVVLAIWIIQLIVSPLWLERFRYGPLEWIWRVATYGRMQPLRKD